MIKLLFRIRQHYQCWRLNREFRPIHEEKLYFFQGSVQNIESKGTCIFLTNGSGKRKFMVCGANNFNNHSFIHLYATPWKERAKDIINKVPMTRYVRYKITDGRIYPEIIEPLPAEEFTKKSTKPRHLRLVR